MRGVKKILSALLLALLIAFGAVAVGLAQDLQASNLGISSQLFGVWKSSAVQMDRYTLSVGMDADTADSANFLTPESEVHRVVYFHNLQAYRFPSSNHLHRSRIPLRLLDLVFLI